MIRKSRCVRSFRLAVLAVLAVMAAGSQALATPIGGLLLADGFESGIGSWIAEGAGGGASISTDAFAGVGALKADYVADFEGARIDIPLAEIDQFAELAIGFVYKEDVGSPSIPPGLRVILAEFGPGGVDFHVGPFLFGGASWAAAPATTFTLVRSDANALALIFQGHTNKPGSFLVDEVTLTKIGGQVPEPTSLALLALGSVVLLRRRGM